MQNYGAGFQTKTVITNFFNESLKSNNNQNKVLENKRQTTKQDSDSVKNLSLTKISELKSKKLIDCEIYK